MFLTLNPSDFWQFRLFIGLIIDNHNSIVNNDDDDDDEHFYALRTMFYKVIYIYIYIYNRLFTPLTHFNK